MSSDLIVRIPGLDDAAHEDGLLMHELSVVVTNLSRYVMRHLDADAGRISPISTTDERALAEQLLTAAEVIRSRATGRGKDGGP